MNSAMKKRIAREQERQAFGVRTKWFFVAVVLGLSALVFGHESSVQVQPAPSMTTAPDAIIPDRVIEALANRRAYLDGQIEQSAR